MGWIKFFLGMGGFPFSDSDWIKKQTWLYYSKTTESQEVGENMNTIQSATWRWICVCAVVTAAVEESLSAAKWKIRAIMGSPHSPTPPHLLPFHSTVLLNILPNQAQKQQHLTWKLTMSGSAMNSKSNTKCKCHITCSLWQLPAVKAHGPQSPL